MVLNTPKKIASNWLSDHLYGLLEEKNINVCIKN